MIYAAIPSIIHSQLFPAMSKGMHVLTCEHLRQKSKRQEFQSCSEGFICE